MKIAHIVSTFPPRIGGMGQVCFEEAKRLAKLGNEVTVFTPQFKNSQYDFDCNFKIVYLKSLLTSANGAWLPQLKNKLKDFDIIHLHFPFYVSAHYVVKTLKNDNQKFVVTYHMDSQVSGWQGFVKKVYDKFFTKEIFNRADRVITLDKEHLQHAKFNDWVDSGKTVEIFNGVDTEVFAPNEETEKLNKIILFVGNLLPFKRFDLLLKAVSRLDDEEVEIMVVGGGYEIDKHKQLAKELGLEDRVLFRGYNTDRAELAKIYSQVNCLAVTSDSGESFSLAAIEALSCGCLVVASDIPGVRGRIEESKNGWLFKPGDVNDLSEKLKKSLSLNEETKKEMSKRCRQIAVEKYDWDKHMQKLISVYKDISSL